MAFRWLTRNWADTTEPDGPAPLELPEPPPLALTRLRQAIERLPRWNVEAVDEPALTLKATHRTRLFGFIDDLTVRLEGVAAERTRVHVRSQARVGFGDLGQNRQNILELFSALKQETSP